MKKLFLTTTFLIAGVAGVLAQGAVNFSNSASDYGDGIDRWVYVDFVGGQKVVDTSWSAQLWENVGGTFESVGGRQNFLGAVGGIFTEGTWLFQGRTLTADRGEATTLQVRIYDGAGTELAQSTPFAYTPPTSASPAPSDLLMTEFRAFAVPEPSTIALGVLGLGALLIFRRRK
jgi:hypothetical protein